MAERLVAHGDVELWSEDFGDPARPTLLLIAGDTASGYGWPDEFVDLLVAGGHHVLRYDHRDTGLSTHREFEKRPYGFDELAADALAVLDGWGVDAAHVVGLGMGGGVGQLVAAAHPDRLLSMVLMNTHALGVDFFGNWRRARTGEATPDGLPTPHLWFVDMAENFGVPVDRESSLDNRVEWWRMLSGDELDFDAAEFRRWEERDIAHSGSWEQLALHPHGCFAEGLESRGHELARITTATLVVQGPLDPINPPPHGRHLADSISGARLTEIPGMGYGLPSAIHRPLAAEILAHTRATPPAPGRSTANL